MADLLRTLEEHQAKQTSEMIALMQSFIVDYVNDGLKRLEPDMQKVEEEMLRSMDLNGDYLEIATDMRQYFRNKIRKETAAILESKARSIMQEVIDKNMNK